MASQIFLMKTQNTDKRMFGWLCEVIARYVLVNQDKQPAFRLKKQIRESLVGCVR